MQKQRYAVTIDAPPEKVWHAMLDDASYRAWSRAFNEGGSYYEGRWEVGSEIRFLGPDPETGKLGGMFSVVREVRPNAFVSIEHLGVIEDGKVDTTSDAVKAWTPAFENYAFTPKDGGTEVQVELDVPDEYVGMFDESWPKALQALKALAET